MPVCPACRESIRVLCACGCGRYRRKYGALGQVQSYISGHNDNWQGARRPLVDCAMCGRRFKASSSRTLLCGIECRTRWLTVNPPNERKRVPVPCAVCGAEVMRAPHQRRRGGDVVCGRTCQYTLVANKLRNRPLSDTKRLALRRDGARCRVCAFAHVVHIHHILPRSKGGSDALENLITLCPNHHGMVHAGLLSVEAADGTADQADERARGRDPRRLAGGQ